MWRYMIYAIVLCSLSHASCNKIYSLPLTLTDSPLVAMLKQNIHPRVIEAIVTAETYNTNGTIPVPLMRFMDNDFYAEVLFGHPGQKMRVSFDTSWIDSWIPAISCSAISITCAMRNKYNPNRSPFSVSTDMKLNVSFGASSLYGRVYYDLVHINQVNITKQAFGAVSQIPWIFIYSKSDGIFGLNMGRNENITQVIWNLQEQKKIDKKIFSFYFNRNPASKKGGTLAFGGVEPRHYKGNFTFVNLVDRDPPQWSFQINNISIVTPERKTISVCSYGCVGIAMTSGNPIAGPDTEIDDLNKAIKAKEFILGRYVVDCPSVPNLPKVKLSIGDRIFTLGGQDYVQKVATDVMTICLSSFKKNDDPGDKTWYIGGAFMSKYYTTFNMDQKLIGFADAQL